MIKVSVTDTNVRNMHGVGKTSNKPYDLNFQFVWLHLFQRDGTPEPFPTKVEIILEKDKDGAALFFAKGEYLLHPSSIYVSGDGKLAISPRLHKPQAAPVQRAA